jgi:hypothetical protein
VRACVFLRAACGGCARDSCARACVRAHHTCEAESCVCGVVCARAGNWKLDGQTLVEIGAGYGTAPPPTSARLPPGTVTPPLRNAGMGALALALASASNRVLSIDKS